MEGPDLKYKRAAINFQGTVKAIFCEESDRNSALIAVSNFNALSDPRSILARGSVSHDYLVSRIVKSLERYFRSAHNTEPQFKNDLMYAARSLRHQATVDPVNTGYVFIQL